MIINIQYRLDCYSETDGVDGSLTVYTSEEHMPVAIDNLLRIYECISVSEAVYQSKNHHNSESNVTN